jgi:hypothetical protein
MVLQILKLMVHVASNELERSKLFKKNKQTKKKVSERNKGVLHISVHIMTLHHNQRVALVQNSVFIHDTRGKIMNGTQIGPQMWRLISHPFYYL